MRGRVAVGLFFLLLVWGNLVAGMEAGLGCPDWPLCHGRLIPHYRIDTFMEFMHRVIAAVATISLLALCRQRFRSYFGPARMIPVLSLTLIAIEIVLGGAVVMLELPVRLTTIHFMIGLSVFLLVCYMAAFDGEETPARLSLRGAAGLFAGLGAFLFMQLVLGAYVRHSDAGLACTDFPTCGGSWFPLAPGGAMLVQFSHRLTAGLIALTLAVLSLSTYLDDRLRAYRRASLTLLVLCIAQIAIGGVVVLSRLQFGVTAVHLAVALGMLLQTGCMWKRSVEKAGLP